MYIDVFVARMLSFKVLCLSLSFWFLHHSILQLVDNFAAQATPGPYNNYDSFKLLVNSVDTSSSSNSTINIGDNVAMIPQSVFNTLKPATVCVSSASFSKESLFSGGNDSLSLITDVFSVTIIGKKVTDLQEKVKLIFRKLPVSVAIGYQCYLHCAKSGVWVWVCVHACVRACVCVRACMQVCACMHACVTFHMSHFFIFVHM